MFNRKKTLVLVLILIIIGAGSVVWKRSHDLSTISKPMSRAIPVQVTIAKLGSVDMTAHYLGKVESAIAVALSSRITANVVEVTKREGDKVTKGEELIYLDDLTLANKTRASEANLRAAQSALVAAESNYKTKKASFERNQRLYSQSAIAQETYEYSQTEADNAYSQLVAARENIQVYQANVEENLAEQGYSRITSSIDGVVTKRMIEPGDMAVPGKTLMSLQALNQGYKITAQVPQEVVRSLTSGSKSLLSHGDQQIGATVQKVYPALDQASLATIEIKQDELPFGLPMGSVIGVDIILNQINGIVVPVDALITNSKGNFVVVVDEDDLVRQLPVQVVGRNAEMVAISGIEPDSRVVVGQENQLMQLTTGKKVLISQNRSEGI